MNRIHAVFLILGVMISTGSGSPPGGSPFAAPPPRLAESGPLFTLSDLPPASLDDDNGFYLFLMMGLREDIDVSSPELRSLLRRIADPRTTSDSLIISFAREWAKNLETKLQDDGKLPWPESDRWLEHYAAHREEVCAFRRRHAPLMERYEKMLQARVLEDFSYPHANFPTSSLPALKRAGICWIAQQFLQAGEGNWQKAVENIQQMNRCGLKLLRTARNMFSALSGLFIIEQAQESILHVLREKKCPSELYQKLNEAEWLILDPVQMIGQTVLFNFLETERMLCPALTGEPAAGDEPPQETNDLRRARVYWCSFYNQILLLSQKSPALLTEQEIKNIIPIVIDRKKSTLTQEDKICGLMNVSWLGIMQLPHLTQEYIDMLRLRLRLRFEFSRGAKAEEIRDFLATCPRRDPLSGKPYMYNEKTHQLYAVGKNRKDDGGDPKLDYVLPWAW